ncbi:MAG: tryptophan-rich sensory protein [Eubacteriales bacterium]|nr:tryptophan-rich sensory protein [Eubacteriales bacterium]
MNLSVTNKGMKVGILLSYLTMITVNALANILPINGVNTGEASARYETLFTPAGYTFGIWGVIYLLLAVYVIFQMLPSKGEKAIGTPGLADKVGRMFILSSLLNAGWIFAWHYNHITLSLGFMLLILATLMRAGWLLREPHCNPKEEMTLRIPFGVYFGWITVATIANASVWLVSRHWDGFGIAPEWWTVIILVVGVAILGVTMYRIRSAAYGITALWAYTGILVRHLTNAGYAGKYTLIIVTVAVSLAVLLILTVMTGVHMRRVAACKTE